MEKEQSKREKNRVYARRYRQVQREIRGTLQSYAEANASTASRDNQLIESTSEDTSSSRSELSNQNVYECEPLLQSDNEQEAQEVLHNNDMDVDVNVDNQNRDLIDDENAEARPPNGPREIEQLRTWAVECDIRQSHLDKLLRILRSRLIPELPKNSKTFLRTESMPYEILEIQNNDGTLTSKYVYFGIAKGLQTCVNRMLHPERTIYLQFNVDGLPIFSASKLQFWPILCKIFTSPDVYKPFLVALFCGEAKPFCVNSFLRDFVTEMNELTRNGIVIGEINFTVRIQCFVCDTPARSFMKMTKGHGGYSACERCTVRGTRKENRTVYIDVDCPERTDESFRRMEDREHHNERSVLLTLTPPINMVTSFVLDYMHLCCIGVMKRLLVQIWMDGPLKFRLSPRIKKELSRRIKALHDHIPCEFQRKIRSIQYAAQWKATEFRFFLLYCGPIVLKGLLPISMYKHFLLLHVACRILCTEGLAQSSNTRAKFYLKNFVMLVPKLYGSRSTVLNMHNLIHLADDAKNMKCSLPRISAFPFENMLGKLKKLVRTPNHPLAQICRRLNEQSFVGIERAMPKDRVQIIKKSHEIINGIVNVLKLRYTEFILTMDSPNNVVLLTDKTIVKITKIFCLEESLNDIKFKGVIWKVKREIFEYPASSRNLMMWELHADVSSRTVTFSLDYIQQKIVKLVLGMRPDTEQLRVFAIPLLHL